MFWPLHILFDSPSLEFIHLQKQLSFLYWKKSLPSFFFSFPLNLFLVQVDCLFGSESKLSFLFILSTISLLILPFTFIEKSLQILVA